LCHAVAAPEFPFLSTFDIGARVPGIVCRDIGHADEIAWGWRVVNAARIVLGYL